MLNRLVCFSSVVFMTYHFGAFAQEERTPDRRFQQVDQNGDGVLTRDEVPDAARFDLFDRDGDGVLTRDELFTGVRNAMRDARPRQEDATAAESEPTFSVERDIAYGDHESQRLDVCYTEEMKNAPVMLYVHGGGWRTGDKSRVGLKPGFFTTEGWVFLSVNYRLIPGGEHPKNVEDVAQTIAWACEHVEEYGGDPEKIFIMGHSAGCHLVSLVATDQRHLEKTGRSLQDVKGVVALDTQAYDIPQLIAQLGGAALYEQAFTSNSRTQRDASPLRHIEEGKGIPPFLVCYSSGMTRIVNADRSEASETFVAALKAAGVQAEAVDATDRTHGEINQRFGDPEDEKVTGRAMRFLNAILCEGE